MAKYRVEMGNIGVIVRSPSVQEDIDRIKIIRLAEEGVPDGTFGAWQDFGKACHCVEIYKGLGFDPRVVKDMSKKDLDQAYVAFTRLDSRFIKSWLEAVDMALKPADEITGPTPLPDDADPNW